MMPSADPEDSDDVKEAIRTCLRKAALVNYTRLSSYAKVQGLLKFENINIRICNSIFFTSQQLKCLKPINHQELLTGLSYLFPAQIYRV